MLKAFSRWRRRRPSLRCLLVVVLTAAFTVSVFLIALEQKADMDDGLQVKLKEPSKKIIVLSYMRSGSTLTADIIQQHPGVFYVFEPLYTMEKMIRGYLTPLYLNKASSLIRMEYTPKMNTIKSFLSCSLQDVDILTLHQHHMDKSQSTAQYSSCIHNTSVHDFESVCLNSLINMCRESDISLVKTIRYKMESVEELLHLNSDLKVVLLIRDPRATLFSRARLFQGDTKIEALKHHVKQASTHCGAVQRDVSDAGRLAQLYPGRVAILLYEKLVENPRLGTKLLYDFLGLTLTPSILGYVHNITGAGLPDNCPVCTTRKNATETANRWRHSLSFRDVLAIDQSCLALYNKLGYVSFPDSASLYDLNYPSWIEKPVPALLTESYIDLTGQ